MTNVLFLLVSASFCIIVITLHFESISFMVNLFSQKVQTVHSQNITSNTRESFISSVLCHNYDNRRFCSFKNLCYAPFEKQFIFVLTNNSVLSGVTNIHDLKTIELSSVTNHNALFMKLAIVTPENRIMKRNRITIEHGYILWRFKWDNIMHVIHDDALPLFTTYKDICLGNVEQCISTYRLAFADEGEPGPLSEWYNIFTSSEPIFLHKVGVENLVCFKEARTGLTTRTMWFQYGFGIPQGPFANTLVTGNHIRQFTIFILQKLKVDPQEKSNNTNAVFFSRKINRKILNEDAVMKKIEDVYKTNFPMGTKLEIHTLDVSTNNTRSILTHLLQSQIAVGMHGSAMILCIFLKPGSAVIELFPFAINPHNVSPIKALCRIPSIGLFYNSWVNNKEDNSVAHPRAPPLLGGIAHLPPSDQQQIRSTTEVPAVQCCHHPAYLYRMFQDTVVDSDLDGVLHEGFQKHKSFDAESFNEQTSDVMRWSFPAPVMNITCSYASQEGTVTIRWIPPVNAAEPLYHIAVAANNLQFSTTSKKPELELLLPPAAEVESGLDVWVKCVQQGQESVDTFTRCVIRTQQAVGIRAP